MIFCLGEGKYILKGTGYQKNNQIFNKSVSETVFNETLSALRVKNFKLPITKWIESKDMTAEEKKNWTSHTETGGYLKRLSYKDVWAELWATLSSDDKKFFGTLPNFDASIFKEITGIEYAVAESLSGKKVSVEIDGKKYEAILQ